MSASWPQNGTKLLNLHLCKTTVIHKHYCADCELRQDFVNWYRQSMYAECSEPTHILFNFEA
jgi:hypothetical protein